MQRQSQVLRGTIGLVIVLGMVCGCASRRQTNEYVDQGTKSVNEVSRAIYGLAHSQPGVNPAAIAPYEQSFDEFRAGQAARFAEIDRALKQQELQMQQLLESLGGLALTAVPGGASVTQVVGILRDFIDRKSAAGVDFAAAVDDKLAKQIETINAQMSQYELDIKTLKLDINAKLKQQDAVADLEQQAKQLDKEQQDSLRQQLVMQLSSQNAAEQAKMEAQFKVELFKVAEEAKVSEQDVKAIVDLSDQDVFQKYGLESAAGGLGLFALLRTFGKSRSKEEVEELRRRLQQLSEENAVIRARNL